MDGNGRWDKRRHLPRVAGHRKGVEAVRLVVETAARINLPALTLYAFSAENFVRRPATEIHFLMKLLHRYLKNELPLMHRNNIRLQFIGRSQMLPQEVQERMAWAKEQTSRNTGMVLHFLNEAAAPLSQERAAADAPQQHPAAVHRAQPDAAAGGTGAHGMGQGADLAQYRHGAHAGAQLWFALGDRGRLQIHGARGGQQRRPGTSEDRRRDCQPAYVHQPSAGA